MYELNDNLYKSEKGSSANRISDSGGGSRDSDFSGGVRPPSSQGGSRDKSLSSPKRPGAGGVRRDSPGIGKPNVGSLNIG